MKSIKYITLSALIIALSITNYLWADEARQNIDEPLLEAFKYTEAEFLKGNISFNGSLMDKYLDIEELDELASDIARDIGIENKGYEDYIEFTEDENSRQLTYWGRDPEGRNITLILFSFIDRGSKIEETVLFVDVEDNSNYAEIQDIVIKVEKVFDKFDSEAEISTCITGTFKGKLDSNEKIKKITKILQIVNGSKVEGIIDQSLVSISAYSPNIDRYIYTGNKKMNLNIAMRYNEYEDKTYIWIGTPIITIAY